MASKKKGKGAVAAIKQNVAQSTFKRGQKPSTKRTNDGFAASHRIGRGTDGNYDNQ